MRPVDPEEISALIDGELPPERAKEVRRAIAEDASLRGVYQQFAAVDADLKASADRVMFQPQVVLPVESSNYCLRVFLTASVLVILRLAMKMATPEMATGLAIALLIVVVGWVLRRLIHASEEECRRQALSDF